MFDVYKNCYGLTGEPFRLGPDYRFSLHHESYANAKDYLEYGIYQGEGFIAITGAAGTGKTTLITEILAGLDRNKIQVATLTSTQLESRDLLYMVASALGLQPDDSSKANLLVEIEAFLIRTLHNGKRSMLIVDEAQGLSASALEELRLLANLQHQYKLLLQIFLVGQEQLLELIHAPAMEPLLQRMVAATSLEPLNFDRTIDYIEHRLKKVGWTGDPAIDEGALREVYRYSGGIPRRINLIANRLFLYGGTEQKHRFDQADSRTVIQGLIDEFLLAPEPPVADMDIPPLPDSTGAARSRSLPRDDQSSAGAPPAEGRGAGDTAAVPGATEKHPPSVPRAPEPAPDPEPVSASPGREQTSAPAEVEPAGAVDQSAPFEPAPGLSPPLKKNSSAKGIVIAVLLLAGAGAAYLWRESDGDRRPVDKPAHQINDAEVSRSLPREVENRPQQSVADAAVKNHANGIIVRSGREMDREKPVSSRIVDRQEISRSPAFGAVETKPEETGPVGTEPVAETESVAVAPASAPVKPAPAKPVETKPTAAKVVAPVVSGGAAPHPGAEMDLSARMSPGKPMQVPGPAAPPASAPVEPAKPAGHPVVEGPVRVDVPVATLDAGTIEARRLRLEQAARRRFLADQARETTPATTPAKSAPVKKKPRFTLDKIVSTLLDGRWSSSGKPASLLPSATTFCNRQGDRISCQSVPKNVKTRYGLARYKVETTLSRFSPQGHFEMTYRTRVKLVDSEADGGNNASATAGDSGWQIKDYSMSCTLTAPDKVSCVDGKGITRKYRQTGLARR